MRLFLALLLFTSIFALAGEREYREDFDDFIYRLTYESLGAAVSLACTDFLVASIESGDGLETALVIAEELHGTSVVLMCHVSHKAGDPIFTPARLDYVADGFQYTVDFADFTALEGEVGRFRPKGSAIVLIAFPKATRGEPFTIYANEDSIEITLKGLDQF